MKLYSEQTRYILTSILLIIFADTLIFAQETQEIDKSEIKQHRFYIGIGAGPSKNQIINEGILSLTALTAVNKNSYSGSFELGYYFSRSFGLSTGLEYSSYSTELSLNSYENKFSTTDSENETYERRVSGSGIKELQDISFLKVPVCLNLQFAIGRRFGFYLQGGINVSLPLTKKYNSAGIFSFEGYYPAYNATFKNLPGYGFSSNATINSDGNLELNTNILEGQGAAGFQCFVSKKIQIVLGATYNRSLSNISKYLSPETFQLSSDINHINSMMGGSSTVITEAMGIRLSFRYYIK